MLNYFLFVISKAGVTPDQLMLVTEAEVAFIYCQQLPVRDHSQRLQDGIEYMVVQLEGTVILNMKFIYADEFWSLCMTFYFFIKHVYVTHGTQ